MISARVAPLARPIRPRIFAPLLSGRGAVASFARAGLAADLAAFLPAALLLAFLPALACFLGLALALPPLAPFLALGAPFFWLAPFFAGAFSGATCAPCAATAAALSLVSALFMAVLVILFCALRTARASRMTIHHSGPPEMQVQKVQNSDRLPTH